MSLRGGLYCGSFILFDVDVCGLRGVFGGCLRWVFFFFFYKKLKRIDEVECFYFKYVLKVPWHEHFGYFYIGLSGTLILYLNYFLKFSLGAEL